MNTNIWIASWNHCDWFGKADLILLLLLSIYSWALMLEKYFLFKKIERANRRFLKHFYDGRLSEDPDSIWSRILERVMAKKGQTIMSEEKLSNLLRRMGQEELAPLGRRLDFLLSVSAVAPFMGLLGTVWGILMAFYRMGLTGTSSISVIASGVSEALIATFVGLLVAIPAALGYNLLNEKLRNFQMQGEQVLEAFYIFLK
jgi:biopolymer transport protein TolQ